MTTVSSTTGEVRTGRRADRHLPGEVGTWVFVLGDMTVFAVFFATYLYYRGQQPELFNASQQTLDQGYGVTNTLLLLTSSLFVVAGVRAVRQGAADLAPWMFASALLCGLGFSVMKLLEYGEKLANGLTPNTNSFYMYFYLLTGLHFFHLLLGMVVLGYLISRSRTALTARQVAMVEGGACFWHMVDLLWIVLFPLLYLVK